MSIQSHLAELEQRHVSLERQIRDALSHPSTDGLVLADLKRKKLQIKDAIVRLKGEVSIH
jgi:hypothetical protein